MATIWGIMSMDSRALGLTLVVLGSLGACDKADEGLTARLMESNNKVVACEKDLAQAKNELGGLKKQLAQAIAEPSRVSLQDPEIIQLVASLRGNQGAQNGDLTPTLNPKEASRIVMQGATAMQGCYERALKRSAALQGKQGLGVTLGITVKPNGQVGEVDVQPVVDKDLTQCFKATVLRWKFPAFTGTAVTIEQKFTLTPKT